MKHWSIYFLIVVSKVSKYLFNRALYTQKRFYSTEYCNIVKTFWNSFQAWFECLTDTEIMLTKEIVFFCNHEDEFLNILFIIVKQYIFNRKCLDKVLNVYTLKDRISEVVRIERQSAFATKRFKTFVKRWKQYFAM